MSLANRLIGPLRWLYRSSILRLALLLSVLFAVGMAIAIFVSITFARQGMLDRVDTTLLSLSRDGILQERLTESGAAIVIPMAELGDLPKAFARVREDRMTTIRLKRDYRGYEDWRAMLYTSENGNPVLVAVPLDDGEEALEILADILWTTAAIVISMALAAGLVLGYLAQRRLVRIRGTLDALAGGDLQARTGIEKSSDDLDEIAQRLDFAASELERLVSQTRNLSASIAHDLRTPLARLTAHIEALPQGDARGAALEETGRLSAIFDTIMRIARIEAGSGTQGFEQTDLRELVNELHDTFDPVVEDHGKRLLVECHQAGLAYADRKMLFQALANLIQNAIAYGGQEITLFVRGHQLGVEDNGPGVDPDHYDEIVKPMVRLDATRESEGTGLGLALVRAIADRHGADLELQPVKPHGLRVTLKLTKM